MTLDFLLALFLGLAALYLGATLPTAKPAKTEQAAPDAARPISVRELLERIAKERKHAAA